MDIVSVLLQCHESLLLLESLQFSNIHVYMCTTTRLLLLFTKFRDLWKKPVAPHFFVFCVQGAFFFFLQFFKTGLVQQF